MREILKIDDRGRLVIPKSAREYLGIERHIEKLAKTTDTITIIAIITPKDRALRLTSVSSLDHSTTPIVEGAIRDGDDVVPLEVNKAGRIHTSKIIRGMLDITRDSYLIAIPYGRQDGVKELRIIPLLDSSEALIVRIIKKGGVEWRILTPIPDDPEALKKHILKRKGVEQVDFYL
jgi:bifunctional DNA-binding transcriptional regulator/antitoxin component of YhaV-PrlF toxin-antitoxin module